MEKMDGGRRLQGREIEKHIRHAGLIRTTTAILLVGFVGFVGEEINDGIVLFGTRR